MSKRYGFHPGAAERLNPDRHRKAKWPLSTKRPRCDVCRKEPPVCVCRKSEP